MRSVSRFAPPLLLMALIFFLSAQPDLNSGLGDVGHDPAQARAHGRVRRCCGSCGGARSATATARSPVAIALAYAVTDELHQTFVEGRHGAPVDVLIDAAGVAIAMLAVRATAGCDRSR